MANEKRLIDALELRKEIEGLDWYHIDEIGYLCSGANSERHTPLYKADDIYRTIVEVAKKSTVDAVEVVRCKDCKHYFHYGDCVYGCRTYGMIKTEHDGFCSQGERKDNG